MNYDYIFEAHYVIMTTYRFVWCQDYCPNPAAYKSRWLDWDFLGYSVKDSTVLRNELVNSHSRILRALPS